MSTVYCRSLAEQSIAVALRQAYLARRASDDRRDSLVYAGLDAAVVALYSLAREVLEQKIVQAALSNEDIAIEVEPMFVPEPVDHQGRPHRVEVYRDSAGGYRYRRIAGNGEIVSGSQSYTRRASARRAAEGLFGSPGPGNYLLTQVVDQAQENG